MDNRFNRVQRRLTSSTQWSTLNTSIRRVAYRSNTSDSNTPGKSTETDSHSSHSDRNPLLDPQSFLEQIAAFQNDFFVRPQIYNVPNILNILLFSIFCLSSTGTLAESTWWHQHWGIGSEFRPWSWPLHSLLTTNFLSASFGIILIHSLAHGVFQGNQRIVFFYMFLVATLSGSGLWLTSSSSSIENEDRQFGPWDVCSALFVAQYLQMGIPPWTTLSSFIGWIRYACLVGSIVIVYYNPYSVLFGSMMGFGLCKGIPMFKGLPT